jgi:cyclophilin family peptidyl-prolyl cis-trans isomerase
MKAPCAALARRALLAAAIGCTMDRRSAIAMVPQPEITSRARLAITIGDAPAQFVTLGLYGTAAPASVKTFESLCTGTLDWAPGLSYSGSAVSQIVKDRYITAGKLSGGDAKGIERSIDRTGYVRSVMVDRAAQLANTDANALSHDRAGLLSVPKGGGAFEFVRTRTARGPPALWCSHRRTSGARWCMGMRVADADADVECAARRLTHRHRRSEPEMTRPVLT